MRDLTQESGYFPPFGFGFLQLVKNSQGKAIDCIFLEISNGLQRMIGLQRDDIKGRRASDIISSKDNFDWTDYFNTALASGKICEISRRIDSIERECNVIVVPSNKDCFTLIIQEIKKNINIDMLLTALGEQCNTTKEHVCRLENRCRRLGQQFQLTEGELQELSLLAVFHDIGKIGVNPSILKKPGSLTAEEWLEMKRHPEIGWRIVKSFSSLQSVADYILLHHERWDGRGYPVGLKGCNIPLPCRILAVIDAYDAMTSDRVYRRKMKREEAVAELVKNAGTQFDPQVVKFFINDFNSDI